MKLLSGYSNLQNIYKKTQLKVIVPFFASIILFICFFFCAITEIISFGFSMVMVIISLCTALAYGVVWPVTSIKSKRNVKKYSPQMLRLIDNDVALKPGFENFFVTNQALVCANGGFAMVPVGNILWMYQKVTTGRLNGVIPIYKYSYVVIAGRDGTEVKFPIKNNGKAWAFLQNEILKIRQDVVLGYDLELLSMFENNINEMVALAHEIGVKRQQGS